MIYNLIGCAGTFDRLHAGHKAFLRFACNTSKKVLIGLTTESYLQTYKPGIKITSFDERRKQLEKFLLSEQLLTQTIIVPISDPFGPALSATTKIEALVATVETEIGAKLVNEKRKELGLSLLPILLMPLVVVEGKPISSTRIRNGEIDNQGNSFVSPQDMQQLFLLPNNLREELQMPFGTLLSGQITKEVIKDSEKVVTVGDATIISFHKQHIFPKLSVIDFSVERKLRYQNIEDEGFTGSEEIYQTINPAGTITPDLWKKLNLIVKTIQNPGKRILLVTGEEDLAVLPLVLLLPLGYEIFYGQPHKGVVKLPVSLTTKKRAKRLLGQFKRG